MFGAPPAQSSDPDPESVRAELNEILAKARAAPEQPWDAREAAFYRTVFPQMANWLPDNKARQLRLRVQTEATQGGLIFANMVPANSLDWRCGDSMLYAAEGDSPRAGTQVTRARVLRVALVPDTRCARSGRTQIRCEQLTPASGSAWVGWRAAARPRGGGLPPTPRWWGAGRWVGEGADGDGDEAGKPWPSQ